MQEQFIQEITQNVLKQLQNVDVYNEENKVPIGVSARHVHLCREHIDILFGKGYQLSLIHI